MSEDERKKELKKQRHAYYLQKKDYLNEKARQRYKEKRADPEFYKMMLQKNNDFYHRKTEKNLVPLTEEEEEAFFKRIVGDIKHVTNLDKDRDRPQKKVKFEQLMSLFTD